MRFRILLVLSAALLLSVGVATAAASAGHARPTAGKKKHPSAQQLCESYGGSYSTRVSDSFFRPFFKKQGVVWVCNSYNGGSDATQALVQSCMSNDGGKATSTLDGPPGFATCWQNPPV
jgi:hypothetical protein